MNTTEQKLFNQLLANSKQFREHSLPSWREGFKKRLEYLIVNKLVKFEKVASFLR